MALLIILKLTNLNCLQANVRIDILCSFDTLFTMKKALYGGSEGSLNYQLEVESEPGELLVPHYSLFRKNDFSQEKYFSIGIATSIYGFGYNSIKFEPIKKLTSVNCLLNCPSIIIHEALELVRWISHSFDQCKLSGCRTDN